MQTNMSIIEKNGKFIVVRDKEPIVVPHSNGQNITTEFSSKEDAEKYMQILTMLEKQKKFKKQVSGGR